MDGIATMLTAALVGMTIASCASRAQAQDRAALLARIAADIEALRPQYPQLAEFSVDRNLRVTPLSIGYAYRTHAPQQTGGWTSGVHHPDAEGVWFHIDLHDPDSTLQLHTQPVTASLCLGEIRVSFLLLEGERTRSLLSPLSAVLAANGVRECAR